MNKKEIITPILAIGLGLAFAIVSVAVFLSHGKSKIWVARKMKLGALLLTLAVVSCKSTHKFTTCYVVVDSVVGPLEGEKNIIIGAVDSIQEEPLISFVNKNTIKGNISIKQNSLSFLLLDSIGKSIQVGRLVGCYNYNSISGDFDIVLEKALNPGKYEFKIYTCFPDDQSFEKPVIAGSINVKNE